MTSIGETRDDRDDVPHSGDKTSGSPTLGRQETLSHIREIKQEAPHWGDKRRGPTLGRQNRKHHIGETRDEVPHSGDKTGSPTLGRRGSILGRQETIEVPYWEEQRRRPPVLGRQETWSHTGETRDGVLCSWASGEIRSSSAKSASVINSPSYDRQRTRIRVHFTSPPPRTHSTTSIALESIIKRLTWWQSLELYSIPINSNLVI